MRERRSDWRGLEPRGARLARVRRLPRPEAAQLLALEQQVNQPQPAPRVAAVTRRRRWFLKAEVAAR